MSPQPLLACHPLTRAQRPARPGFTMIELLVAVSVLALMMGLASRIFYDAQTAVSRGMQTSQLITEQRAVSQPIFEDFRNMHVFESPYGGNTPGFLVIVQQQNQGVLFPPINETSTPYDGWINDVDNDGFFGETNGDDFFRTDQIAFFRDATGLESLTPGAEDRYDSAARARTARVWYGHGWPAEVDPDSRDEPGDLNYNIASQMVLARQALLLVEGNGATRYPDGTSGFDGFTGTVGSGNDNRFIEPGTTALSFIPDLLNGGFDVLSLNDYRRPTTSSGLQPISLYDDGGTDVAGAATPQYAMFRGPGWEPLYVENSYFDGLLTKAATGAAGGPGAKWGSDDRLTNVDYANAAFEWTYGRVANSNPNTPSRLRVAKDLNTDFSAGIFTAEDLGKLHGNFSPHLADFIIEFAADWHDDLDPNDFNTNGIIDETDGLPDGEPDRDGGGNIVWYTLLYPNPDNNNADNPFETAGNYDGIPNDPDRLDQPITYLVPDDLPAFDGTAGTIPNPFTYLRGGGGGLTPFRPTAADPGVVGRPVVFVFSHSGDDLETGTSWGTTAGVGTTQYTEGSGKYWPYLIRIRYRLMDGKGDFRSVNPISGRPVVGRWFEQIIAVPRPQGIF